MKSCGIYSKDLKENDQTQNDYQYRSDDSIGKRRMR